MKKGQIYWTLFVLCSDKKKDQKKKKNTPKREDNFWDRSGYAKQCVYMCCIMLGHMYVGMYAWYKNDADPFTVKSYKSEEYGKKCLYIRRHDG